MQDCPRRVSISIPLQFDFEPESGCDSLSLSSLSVHRKELRVSDSSLNSASEPMRGVNRSAQTAKVHKLYSISAQTTDERYTRCCKGERVLAIA